MAYQFLTTTVDTNVCGPKGGRLLELLQIGLPVPPLVCVPANAYLQHVRTIPEFDFFAHKVPLSSSGSDLSRSGSSLARSASSRLARNRDMQAVMSLAETIQRRLLDLHLEEELQQDIANFLATIPGESVAVRSSCVSLEDGSGHAFAGQFETVLNVKTPSEVGEAVKTVWASLWSTRILSFMKAGKITDSIVETMGKAAMAVIIQVQVASRSSGICFSVNPDPSVTHEGILCEAVWGQGQGIVDGSITPDQWIVSRDAKTILSETIAEKRAKVELKETGIETVQLQKGMEIVNVLLTHSDHSKEAALSAAEVLEVSSYVLKLEEHFQKPQDMEFAVSQGGKVFVLQTRPITVMSVSDGEDWEADPIPEGIPPSPFPISDYTAPDPTKTYFLDHIHVTSALSRVTSVVAGEHLNRGFRDAAKVYGSPVVNQILPINGYVFGYQHRVPQDEEAKRRAQNVFVDRNYLKELTEWQDAKVELVTKHLALQKRVEQGMDKLTPHELAQLVLDCWAHLEWTTYLHGRYGWAHRIIMGDLLANIEEWTGATVSGLDVLNTVSRFVVGTPNMRMPVLEKIVAAFNTCHFASEYLLAFAPPQFVMTNVEPKVDGSPTEDVAWRSADAMLRSLLDITFYDDSQLTVDSLVAARDVALKATSGVIEGAEARDNLRETLRMFFDWHGYVLCGSTDINSATYMECPMVLVNILQDVVRRYCVDRKTGAHPEASLMLQKAGNELIDEDPEFKTICAAIDTEEHREQFRTQFWEALQCSVLKNERVIYTDAWSSGILRHVLLFTGQKLVEKGFLRHRGHVFEVPIEELVNVLKQDSLLSIAQKKSGARYEAIVQYKMVAGFAGVPKRLGAPPPQEPPKSGDADNKRLVRAIKTYRKCVGHADDTGKQGTKALPADLKQKVEQGHALQAIAASKGVAEGIARYIDNPAHIPLLRQGEIAVITQASPAFSGVLACCAAVVTEQGGILCHIAICARELHLPAVVGCGNKANGTNKLVPKQLDGMRVRVHGHLGIVEVLPKVGKKVIAVLGGTGRIGSAFIKAALKQGHEVRALVRSQSKEVAVSLFGEHKLLTIVTGDAMNSEDVGKILGGCDAVVNNVGPRCIPDATDEVSSSTKACIEAMKAHNVSRFLIQGGILLLTRPGTSRMWCDETEYPGFFKNNVNDMIRAKALLEASETDYIMMSCGRFIEGEGTRATVTFATQTLHQDKWRSRVYVGDLVHFMLSELTPDAKYSRQLVGVESSDAMLLDLGESEGFKREQN